MSSTVTLNKSRKPRERKLRHPMVPRSYRFRLDVSPEQSAKLHSFLDACHTLRNRPVTDRLENREWCKEQKCLGNGDVHYLNRADQCKAVSQYAKGNPVWAELHSQVSQNKENKLPLGGDR